MLIFLFLKLFHACSLHLVRERCSQSDVTCGVPLLTLLLLGTITVSFVIFFFFSLLSARCEFGAIAVLKLFPSCLHDRIKMHCMASCMYSISCYLLLIVFFLFVCSLIRIMCIFTSFGKLLKN